MKKSKTTNMSKLKKSMAALGAALAIIATAVVPAHAEGYWESYVSNGRIGVFYSRWWQDNIDATSTGVRFSSCSGIPVAWQYLNVTLYRDNGIFPDHTHGVVANSCGGTYSNWGRMTAVGSYRWGLTSVKLSSGPVTTGYDVNIGSLRTNF